MRSRRPAVLRRLHAIDATRVHLTMPGVVSFSSLRPFGPRLETAMLRAGFVYSGVGPDYRVLVKKRGSRPKLTFYNIVL